MKLVLSLFIYSYLFFLTGCSGSSTDSTANKAPDPLASSQWYLFNTAQSSFSQSGRGGTPRADMNGFSSNQLTLENYALGMSGKGIEIAIIDSGLEIAHEDLVENVIPNGSYNFAFPHNEKSQRDPTSNAPKSEGDHGTSVAGIAAARAENGIGIFGVAPNAKLRGFNLLAAGDLNAELASLGFQSAVENFNGLQNKQVSIFNKSYGTNPNKVLALLSNTEQIHASAVIGAMQEGTSQLRDGKGAIYVKAAGNEFSGGNVFDENYCSEAIAHNVTCYNSNQEPENVTPYQIIVGAFNANDKRASYSNTGSAIWISGAGGEFGVNQPALMTTDRSGCDSGYSRDSENIEPNTSFNRGSSDNLECNYYASFNGTSVATPTLSGAVALILEANPNAHWRDVKYILAKSARKLNPNLSPVTMNLNGASFVIDQAWETNSAGFNFSNAFGFGAVDIINAVALAKQRQQGGVNLPAMQTLLVESDLFSTNNIIANQNAQGLTKSLAVSNHLTVESVELMIDVSATNPSSDRGNNEIDAADYLVEITSPSGTKSIVMTPFNAYLSGHELKELKVISHAFYGEAIAGNWSVTITDVDGSTQNFINHVGEGKLNKFSLTFYGH